LVAVLLLLALVSLGLAQAGPMWSDQVRREREQELLRVGTLYAQALASYRALSPGSLKQYPDKLEALALDARFVGTVRHLRKLYPDPVNPGMPWGTVKDPSGRIVGVYSQSEAQPLADRPMRWGGGLMPAARSYTDWKFLAQSAP
jgi:type II secretory pathway pseudopilin PulG